MSGARVRILVADPSPVYKKMFQMAAAEFKENPELSFAASREEALAKLLRGGYDAVVIDEGIAAPGEKDLVSVVGEVAKALPRAVILVTAGPSKRNGEIFSRAILSGAADCLTKPIYGSYNENYAAVKQKAAELLKQLKIIRSGTGADDVAADKNGKTAARRFRPELVLVAASTGGPRALGKILPALDGGFAAPILIVQHIPAQYTESMAKDLDQKSNVRVKVAEHRETIRKHTAYLAPGGFHMRLGAERKIQLESSPPIGGMRPSADALFASVAEGPVLSGVVAVMLSGMGRDGSLGLKRLKEKQECRCLCQSEISCVVYGMPRAAVESGLADEILDLDDIAGALMGYRYAPGWTDAPDETEKVI